MEIRELGFALLLSVGSVAMASSPFKQSLTMKKNHYLADGLFIGGKAGNGSSLLGLRRAFSAKAALERVIVDLGDGDGKPAGKHLGYFQASVDAGQNRVVLDLAQLKLSKISEQQIKGLFKDSPYVASVEFTLDPEDKAGTMVLNLKRPMQLEVFELLDSRKPGRVVLDLTPARTTRMKGHG
jgi:hypothetical protein